MLKAAALNGVALGGLGMLYMYIIYIFILDYIIYYIYMYADTCITFACGGQAGWMRRPWFWRRRLECKSTLHRSHAC